jgi:hypothetical protein
MFDRQDRQVRFACGRCRVFAFTDRSEHRQPREWQTS